MLPTPASSLRGWWRRCRQTSPSSTMPGLSADGCSPLSPPPTPSPGQMQEQGDTLHSNPATAPRWPCLADVSAGVKKEPLSWMQSRDRGSGAANLGGPPCECASQVLRSPWGGRRRRRRRAQGGCRPSQVAASLAPAAVAAPSLSCERKRCQNSTEGTDLSPSSEPGRRSRGPAAGAHCGRGSEPRICPEAPRPRHQRASPREDPCQCQAQAEPAP